ncbi:MAG: FlgB family protein [Paracoccaceae bacterium]
MLEKLGIFRMAHGLAAHASARQSEIARNVANADTPQYRARDIASFAESFDAGQATSAMRATRPKHLDFETDTSTRYRSMPVAAEASPNGNTVSLETEMMKATEVRHQHDLALSVYSSSLNILRTSLGRGR